MLSSQTKDPVHALASVSKPLTAAQVTAQAVLNLRNTLPGGLTLDSILAAPETVIQECINKVGFWRRKTDYIKATAQLLKEGEGDVPKTIDGLLDLPGVGPKMGFLALQSCWDLNHGIGVGELPPKA
jgi:endonuclease-3